MKSKFPDNLYERDFVAALFDEMAASYGLTNYISSLGFCERWRRQCIEGVEIKPGMIALDLMTGMGECWSFLQNRLREHGSILALDLSAEMCHRAKSNGGRLEGATVSVWRGDALEIALPDASVDCIVASFGLKTFSTEQLNQLARQISRLLKPSGSYSLVEISVPSSSFLRVPYLWYLRHCIPLIGRMFLGNPDNYRLLSVYTERFCNGAAATAALRQAGLDAHNESLFFGCAQRFRGKKLMTPTS